jgi:hypothetical protein
MGTATWRALVIATFNSADAGCTVRATIDGDVARKANATREARETGEGGTP